MNKPLKILHLEDLPTDAELVERALKRGDVNFEKIVVDNKNDYIKALTNFQPHIILSDHSLPSFNSLEALAVLRERGIKLPFILITATISEEFAVDVMKAGADDYILKDRLQRLPNAIHNIMEKFSLERQRERFLSEVIASEALLKDTEHLARIGSFDDNLITGKLQWSAELYLLFGYEPDKAEPSFENFLKRVHPEDISHIKELMEGAFATMDALHMSFRIVMDDKTIKYIRSEIVIERNDNKQAVRIRGFNQDITEQRIAEENLRRSEERLKEAQAISLIGSWEIDMVNNALYWSDEQFNLMGFKRGEITPTNELFFSFIHPDDFESVTKQFNDTFVTHVNSHSNFRLRLKDGTIKHAFCEWKFEFDKNKKPVRIYGIVQDITETKMAEIEREKITADLVQRNNDLEQFTYIVSHNLRAPVANIIGLTGLSGSFDLDEKERKVLLAGLNTSTKKLDEVIMDLNNILQVRHGINEKKEYVHFSELLYDIRQSIGDLIKKEDVHFNVNFSAVDKIYTLKSFTYSIFLNLVTNSIKYRRPDVQPVIDIKSEICDDKIVLTLKDNGLGIDMNKYDKQVFGLYKRFHTHAEGKGMGLYLVKTQVEALGGRISLNSEPNKGTIFKIEFENTL